MGSRLVAREMGYTDKDIKDLTTSISLSSARTMSSL